MSTTTQADWVVEYVKDIDEMAAKQMVCHKAWLKSNSDEYKHSLAVANKEVDSPVLATQVTRIHC